MWELMRPLREEKNTGKKEEGGRDGGRSEGEKVERKGDHEV